MRVAPRQLIFSSLIVLCISLNADALDHGPNDVYVRVIDVGQGLCCVASMPDHHYLIYDAGVGNGETVFQAIAQTIPPSSDVDLVVLSHTDADHLAAVPEIMNGFHVKTVWRPDHQPGSESGGETSKWKNAREAIEQSHCEDPGLDSGDVGPGTVVHWGEVSATMACGFTEPPDEWGLTNKAERRNAGSIVVRLDFKGKSVLFCGDSVGRHNGDPSDACIAAESFMVAHSTSVPLRSDVIIAPHHGADNGSSTQFIEAVHPEFVVFSAGHNSTYRHPRATAAQRYLDFGVPITHMFRTDLEDDEGDVEWDYGRKPNYRDEPWDDDVDIVIRNDGSLSVEYANPMNTDISRNARLLAETGTTRFEFAPRDIASAEMDERSLIYTEPRAAVSHASRCNCTQYRFKVTPLGSPMKRCQSSRIDHRCRWMSRCR